MATLDSEGLYLFFHQPTGCCACWQVTSTTNLWWKALKIWDSGCWFSEINANTHCRYCLHDTGPLCPPWSLMDTSIADGSEIRSTLTLEMQALAKQTEGPVPIEQGGRKWEGKGKKGAERGTEGHTRIGGPWDEWLWDSGRGIEGVLEGEAKGGRGKREAIWQQHKCIKL